MPPINRIDRGSQISDNGTVIKKRFVQKFIHNTFKTRVKYNLVML